MADADGRVDIVRAWNDDQYRASLTPEQLAGLPPKPDGDGELSEEELEKIDGGIYYYNYSTYYNNYSNIIGGGSGGPPPPPPPGGRG
jgi:mersacidin/lichenicidin family type 2 lantibiotic